MLAVEKSIKDQMIELVDLQKLENTLSFLSPERFKTLSLKWHLDKWATNKQHLFTLLGNKLKVESPVESTLPRATIRELFNTFVVETELYEQSKFKLLYYFLNRLDVDEVASNTLSNNYEMFDTVFKKGMKVSRVIAKLVNKDYVHDIQTKYSMFLQKLKSRGMAVISIDPIDYITMSVNKSGWRSCHALDGEYRAGTLAYLIDKSTMISYVKTSEDITISDECLPYSNKIWRQVVVVNKALDFAIQSRQYPSEVINNSNTISDMLKACFLQTGMQDCTWERQPVAKLCSFVDDGEYYDDRLWYNDILSESFNYGTIVYNTKFSDLDGLYSNTDNAIIGGMVRCVEDSDTWLANCGYLSDRNYRDDREDEYYDEDDYEDDDDNREW